MTESPSKTTQENLSPDEFASLIDNARFRAWREEREFVENIQEGKPFFNGPSSEPPEEKHNPSRLMQCHRKVYYKCKNAPKEQQEPAGIFWFGSEFETEFAVPFLRDVVGPDQFVRNSMWVDYTIKTEAGSISIRGETDPVIVDRESTPSLLTEIKTSSAVDHMDSPKVHHKAQAHAYMYGLADEYDCDIRDALLIYGGRDNLEIAVFHTPFDPVFWRNSVLSWAADNTQFRERDELPPPDPEFDWECKYCSYRERCGQTDEPFEDCQPTGLMPLTEYPRSQVEDYLMAHEEAALTPSLAHHYPELAAEYEVSDWHCEVCGSTFDWDEIESLQKTDFPNPCPDCSGDHPPGSLTGPRPSEQAVTENIHER